MFVSIRIKILAVLSVLLVTAIFAYLLLADRIFREDKQLLVFDTNRANAERIANDLEISLHRVLDKTEMLSKLILNDRSVGGSALVRDFFNRDAELLLYQLIHVQDSKSKVLRELEDTGHLAALKITSAQIKASGALDFNAAEAKDQVSLENVSLPGAVLYVVRVPIEVKEGKHRLFAQIIIDGHIWLDNFQNQALSLNFAISRSGRLLAHPRAELVLARTDMSRNGLVKIAATHNVNEQQVEFEQDHVAYLGVYQKASIAGITAFSMMAKNAALSASLLLLEKTIVLSVIVVTVVLLISLWFAGSLSRPLRALVRASGEIAKGRFDTRIEVYSRDEIGELAVAFDRMARDLKSSRVQLEDYSRSLEAKVQERTQELESKNVAIREQQDVLVRTTRLAAVGEIAGQAAHEVLNPLTGMIARLEGMSGRLRQFYGARDGGVDMLKIIARGWSTDIESKGVQGWLDTLTGPSRVYPGKMLAEEDLANLARVSVQFDNFGAVLLDDMKLLLDEAFRISRIVDGMRGLSRITSNRGRVDVIELVRDCVRTTEDLLRKNRITIETELVGCAFADLDRDEMRQVLANLIKNGMDAIVERVVGGTRLQEPGKIIVKSHVLGSQIHLLLWDNGMGIPLPDRQKIFEAHFTTKGSEGTGFGLSICRRFVRAAGGELSVHDSEPGKFTEFEVILPLSEEDHEKNITEA
ncbi:MAG: HAMP domain-containing protein [Deltaproteobacteria bacterium]|nr:HAMP domain-containing protein [Deltaproteobacteria bacterium]